MDIMFVVPGLLALGLLVALTAGARQLSLALLVVMTPLAAFGALYAFFTYHDGRCDETCGDASGWTEAMGSWQWTGQFVVAALGFLGVVAVAVLAARGRYSTARLPLLGAALGFAAWAIFQAPLTSRF